jgi:hypothetical protein
MRAPCFIGGVGVFLLQRFHWVIYPFAALLLWAAARMLWGEQAQRRVVEASCALCTSWIARFIPITPVMVGSKFIVRSGGRWTATPLLVALVAIESVECGSCAGLDPRSLCSHARSVSRLHLQRVRAVRPALVVLLVGGLDLAPAVSAGLAWP